MTNIFYVNGYRKGFAIRQCLCKFFYIDTYKSKFEKNPLTALADRLYMKFVFILIVIFCLRSEKSDFVKVISLSILSDIVFHVSILIRAVASTLYKRL